MRYPEQIEGQLEWFPDRILAAKREMLARRRRQRVWAQGARSLVPAALRRLRVVDEEVVA
jgi:hypothetical protein